MAQIFEENQALRAELDAARQSFRSERAAREEVQDVLHQMRADITRLLSVSEKALWDSMPPPPPPPEKRAEEPEREVAGKPAPEPGQPRPDPEPPRTVEEALSLIYRRKESETCATVAEALHLVPMQDWEPEEFDRLKEALDPVADWLGDHNDRAHTLFLFEQAPILFGTSDGVLIYEHGLKLLTWAAAMERIAPEVDEARRQRELAQRQQEMAKIMRARLPQKRKLQKMRLLLEDLMALRPTTIKPEVERAVCFIGDMKRDDERFAHCQTFEDYLLAAAEITAPPESAAAPEPVTEQNPPAVSEFVESVAPPEVSGSVDPPEVREPVAPPSSPGSSDALLAEILAADLGTDAEARKGGFFSAMRTASEMGVLTADLAALLPSIRAIIAHDPSKTRRLFGFMNAKGILGAAAEMVPDGEPLRSEGDEP